MKARAVLSGVCVLFGWPTRPIREIKLLSNLLILINLHSFLVYLGLLHWSLLKKIGKLIMIIARVLPFKFLTRGYWSLTNRASKIRVSLCNRASKIIIRDPRKHFSFCLIRCPKPPLNLTNIMKNCLNYWRYKHVFMYGNHTFSYFIND